MLDVLRDQQRSRRRGDWAHELRRDGRAVLRTDQRMMTEDIERHRIFAGDHPVDERACAAGTEIHDLLRRKFLEVVFRLFLAPGGTKIRDEQRRAALAADPPGDLALPLRIEKVLVALRNVGRLHHVGVIGHAVIAHPCRGPQVVGIAVGIRILIEHRRGEGLNRFGLDQVLADAGAFDDVDDDIVGAFFGKHTLRDILGVTAPEGHAHRGILLHEGLGERLQGLIGDHCRIDNELAFLGSTFRENLLSIGTGIMQDLLLTLRKHRCSETRQERERHK